MRVINKTRLKEEDLKVIADYIKSKENIVCEMEDRIICIYKEHFYKVKISRRKFVIDRV